jgi:hypothetical protein
MTMTSRHLAMPARAGLALTAICAAGTMAALPLGSAASSAATTRTCHVHAGVRSCTTATLRVSSASLLATGGTVVIHYSASGASTCSMKATPIFWRGRNPATVRCSGSYTVRVPPAYSRRAWTFRFTARNRFGQATTATRVLHATAPPVQIPIFQDQSTNWSGYALEGGAFTGAQGTFTVPGLTPKPSQTDVSEWVGVDGVSNSNLIQAGVHEIDTNGVAQTYAWWEVLPDPETPINMPVQPGDSVTVQIKKLSTGRWNIVIADTTRNELYQQAITGYTGPGTSAEWIVEAPSYGNAIAHLGQYTPNVSFTQLGVTGVRMAFDRIFMVSPADGTSIISSPSDLLATGFNVAWGAIAPAPPS